MPAITYIKYDVSGSPTFYSSVKTDSKRYPQQPAQCKSTVSN